MEKIEIGPNKRAGLIMLVIALAFFLYAYLNYDTVDQYDYYEIGHLFIIHTKTIFRILMLLFPLAFAKYIQLNVTKKRMYVTDTTLIITDGRKIPLTSIEKIVRHRINFITFSVYLHLKDGSRIFIPNSEIGCGSRKFISLLSVKNAAQKGAGSK